MTHPCVLLSGVSRFPGGSGPAHVLRDVSLELPEGARLALVGGNGAGKSTLIRLLLGIAPLGAGTAAIFGRPVPSPASREDLGYVPESAAPFPHLTGREYLSLFARLEGLTQAQARTRTDELLTSVNLGASADTPTRRYSKGQRQRLDVARLFLRPRRLLVLDEPFSGLDAPTRIFLEDKLSELASQGISMIMTSHHAGFLERICTHVALLHEGRLVRFGHRDEILAHDGWRLRFEGGEMLPDPLPQGATAEPASGSLLFADRGEAEACLASLAGRGLPVTEYGPALRGLDDLLREVMGR